MREITATLQYRLRLDREFSSHEGKSDVDRTPGAAMFHSLMLKLAPALLVLCLPFTSGCSSEPAPTNPATAGNAGSSQFERGRVERGRGRVRRPGAGRP